MTEAQALASPLARAREKTQPSLGFAIACAIASGVALTYAHALDIWNTGAFYDTDDALRMTQVRDLLAGQSWYDMTVARMNPPEGVFMHWSRTVDVPLVLLVKFFGLFAPAHAEALTRLAFPLLLLVGLYGAVAWVASLFGDRAAQVAAIGLAFATGPMFTQFVPGRIDHHAPQILLLTLAAGACLAALDPARARLAALTGALMALSLSISVENAPFFAVLAAAPALAWIVRGPEQAPAMRSFALGLLVALQLCFVATIGPTRWLVAACDAYSLTYLAAGVAGALALLALGALSSRLRGPVARLLAAGALGGAPLVAIRLVAPSCLGDPFVGLDPLVRSVWLAHVAEVQKLSDLAQTHPSGAIVIGAPLALATLATFGAALASRGLIRMRLLLLAALIATGFAMTFWGVRVFSSTAPLAAVGGAVAAVALARRLARPGALGATLAGLLCLPFAPMAYAFVLPTDKPTEESRSLTCLRPDAMKPLDALPPGLALAPIDAGSHLLALTHHSVLAAPYHRNNSGNRLSLDAFMAPPNKAEAIVRASHADYLVMCDALMQARIIAARAPDGLAAALIAGHAPPWLEKLDIGATPNVVYRIRPSRPN